jgi:hypothetical protein
MSISCLFSPFYNSILLSTIPDYVVKSCETEGVARITHSTLFVIVFTLSGIWLRVECL